MCFCCTLNIRYVVYSSSNHYFICFTIYMVHVHEDQMTWQYGHSSPVHIHEAGSKLHFYYARTWSPDKGLIPNTIILVKRQWNKNMYKSVSNVFKLMYKCKWYNVASFKYMKPCRYSISHRRFCPVLAKMPILYVILPHNITRTF